MNWFLPSRARKFLTRSKQITRGANRLARPRLEALEDRLAPATLVHKSITGSWSASATGTFSQEVLDENDQLVRRTFAFNDSDSGAFTAQGKGGGYAAFDAPNVSAQVEAQSGKADSVHQINGFAITDAHDMSAFLLERSYNISAKFKITQTFEIKSDHSTDAPVSFVVDVSRATPIGLPVSTTTFTIDSKSYTFDGTANSIRITNKRVGDTFEVSIAGGNSASGGLESSPYTVSEIALLVPEFAEEVSNPPDLDVDPLQWDTSNNEVDFGYKVTGPEVTADTALALYWAKGTKFEDRIGTAIRTEVIPTGAAAGHSETFSIKTADLGAAPAGATHLLAIVDESGEVAESNETNNVETLRLPDIKPVGLTWDAAGKRVKIQYEVKDAPLAANATYNLFWAKGATKLSGPLLTGDNKLNKAIGAGSDFKAGDLLGTVSDGATHLLLEVDAGANVPESDETNNLFALAYDPKIETITATYDDDPSEDTIGRFFSKVPISGQKAQVRISESLAVVTKGLQVTIGAGPKQTLEAGADNQTFITSEFDPGALDEPTDLVFKAIGRGDATLAERKAKIDVVPLPEWFEKISPLDNKRFDAGEKKYIFSGNLLNVQTSQLPGFALPSTIWFGAGLTTGVDVTASVEVKAGLSPTAAPQTSAKLTAVVKVLGEEKFRQSYSTGGSSPLTATFDLKPRTLEINTATLSFTLHFPRSHESQAARSSRRWISCRISALLGRPERAVEITPCKIWRCNALRLSA